MSDRLIEKGPTFEHPTETSIDASTGQVIVRYTDDDGKEKMSNDRLKLPTDLANGLIPILMTNVQPRAPRTTVSLLEATPKPRLVKLAIAPAGEESFSAGGWIRVATRYSLKIEIGGVAGVVAPLATTMFAAQP